VTSPLAITLPPPPDTPTLPPCGACEGRGAEPACAECGRLPPEPFLPWPETRPTLPNLETYRL
jgi:hypothetical protein